jgi:hypothetical protein
MPYEGNGLAGNAATLCRSPVALMRSIAAKDAESSGPEGGGLIDSSWISRETGCAFGI